MIQYPFYFSCRKVGIDDQSGLLLNKIGITFRFQLLTIISCAAILPHNRIVNRKTRLTVPHNRRLTLIGYTDTGNMVIRHIGFRHRFLDRKRLCIPYLVRVMLYPTRLRKILLERFLRECDDLSLTIKQDGPGRSCSLINSQYIFMSEIHVISLYNL